MRRDQLLAALFVVLVVTAILGGCYLISVGIGGPQIPPDLTPAG